MGPREGSTATGSFLVDDVAEWLISQALDDVNMDEILKGCCDRLLAAGVPLWRSFMTFRTLHPLFAGESFVWRREQRSGTIEHWEHLHESAFSSDEWRASPVYHLMHSDVPYLRRRLVGEGALLDFPVCEDLRDQGATDYLVYRVAFATHEASGGESDGIISSWATDRPSGFTDADVSFLFRIQRRLVVACKVQLKAQVAQNVLSAYLGMDAGRQVLNGQIRRGDGEMLHAVIWFSDMRDSTRLADELPPEAFLGLLNTYFECTAGAVLAHGGEVLRFIGDAVLAIFPIREGGMGGHEACRAALVAAEEAERRLASVNAERAAREEPPIDYGLGLHVGDVMFGNIGVPERVEFSVIGPAANEAARLEGLTKSLGRRVLVSGEFVRHAPGDWQSLGEHALRGVGTPLEVLAPRVTGLPAARTAPRSPHGR